MSFFHFVLRVLCTFRVLLVIDPCGAAVVRDGTTSPLTSTTAGSAHEKIEKVELSADASIIATPEASLLEDRVAQKRPDDDDPCDQAGTGAMPTGTKDEMARKLEKIGKELRCLEGFKEKALRFWGMLTEEKKSLYKQIVQRISSLTIDQDSLKNQIDGVEKTKKAELGDNFSPWTEVKKVLIKNIVAEKLVKDKVLPSKTFNIPDVRNTDEGLRAFLQNAAWKGFIEDLKQKIEQHTNKK